jgi:PAS domain S-box-containing protein
MTSRADPTVDQARLLIGAVTDYAIFLLDTEGHVRTWNEGARRIKGYEAHEIVGEHFSRFYVEADRARNHPATELEIAAAEGRYEEEGWRLRKDGSRFWASVVITALRDDTGTLVGFGKVTRDLTSRRLAEEQLRVSATSLQNANQQLQQFRLMVASVRDYGIFMLDPGGYVTTWNEGARHMKGYEESEIIGRHFSIFYTAEDRDRNHPAHELEVAVREGRYEEEGWRVRKDGTTFWASVVITALRNEHGVLVGFGKVTRDLSERRAAEEGLREVNRELERFASAAAHDLSEPLHTIVGLVDLTRRRAGDALDAESLEYLDHVSDGARRLRLLVDALLEYSRASQRELHRTQVSIAQAVRRVVDALSLQISETDGTVVYDREALPVVAADGPMIELVLQNLISNALKFRGEAPPRVEITARRDDGVWCLEVRDNGIGISDEHLAPIFDLFQRLHPAGRFPGSGLGLALVKRIVERHGGRLGVESTVGEGSRFWFTLPAPETAQIA